MRRIVALLLLLSTVLSFVTACRDADSNRSYDEQAVLSATADLVQKSDLINRIFWGTGIPVSDAEGAKKTGKYVEADAAFLSENGFLTIEDLKKMTTKVYDSEFCQLIFDTKLSAVSDDSVGVVSSVRYYQETGDVIMVDTQAVVYFEKPVVYHTDTLAVKEVKGEIIYLTLDVTVLDESDAPVIQQLTVAIIEEDDGFRLVNPTYDKYIAP